MSDDVLDKDQAPPPREALEDNRLTGAFVDEVTDALAAGDTARVQELAEPLHPADIADLIEQVEPHERQQLAAALGDVLDADVISEMNEVVREQLIDVLDAGQVADVVTQMETDDAVAILEDMDEEDQAEVLRSLPADERAAIEEALSYPEESAGRLMQRDLIAVPEYWTVGQVIDFLRQAGDDVTSDFWEIFVVDPAHKPVGTMRLSLVLRSPRNVLVTDLMNREQTLIPVDMDQEEVALRFQKYALISAAVVDPSGRLVGVVTVDDVVHIIQEEADEDILRLSGAGDGDINDSVREIVSTRLRWLVVNLGTAIIASIVIGFFAGTIEKMVALAILMPIVSALGGNAATQTMAVTVRALATDQLTEANTRRTITKEIRVAVINGAAIATLVGVVAGLYFANVHLGLVIATAMIGNIIVAGLAGVMVPLTLDRMEVDPAVSSPVFVTMTTDVMGFLFFLGLAAATGLTG
ncbi:magnesium transporter [Sphingosinicella microcystinivorans]|uniref:Magnesium transporter MgtE n=1 Tax=Sphingosinicella microcystinivorans TaxID=335406 RepID=A0AAD1G2K2_SPHMI|nr:magnesium transporter [Sphingosinicella microcystinivorans]RKS88082.1 magnesium transporter [Sphingosinicella microcystinivorans]BBE35893.1 magnesium transporter MgtE [Sphingosinicella microcystinivorans]